MTYLTDLHDDIRRTRLTRRGATRHPKDVPTGTHKSYARMERILLPPPVELQSTLQGSLQARRSYPETLRGEKESMSIGECGTLFGSALGKKKGSYSRAYPSGGALYPIETYFVTSALEDHPPGVYHYNPTEHALEFLWGLGAVTLQKLMGRPDWLDPHHAILFTSVWERSAMKYGDLSYQHALLEAGHMSQNILLVATALGLHVRPLAGFDDAMSSRLLDIEADQEQVVHSVALKKVARLTHTHESSGMYTEKT